MAVAGLEARMRGGVYGDGYLGGAHRRAQHRRARRHARGRPLVRRLPVQAKLLRPDVHPHGNYQGPQNQTRTVDNISFQYQFSFGALARYPEEWWGDGPTWCSQCTAAVDRGQQGAAHRGRREQHRLGHEHEELKWGFDTIYTPLYWLGFNTRFDYVQPDLDAASRARPATLAAAT